MLNQMLATKYDRESLDGEFSDPFLESIKSGNCKAINMLIKAGIADVNRKYQGYGADGRTPLHFAVETGNKEVVLLLLKNRANVKALTNNGFSALHLAAQCGHMHIFEDLIKAGIDINWVSEVRTTAIHEASRNGHQAAVSKLLAIQATATTQLLKSESADEAKQESVEEVNQMLNALTLTTRYKKEFIQKIQLSLKELSNTLEAEKGAKPIFASIMKLRLSLEGVTSADHVYRVTREYFMSDEFKKYSAILNEFKQVIIKFMKEYNEDQVRANANNISSISVNSDIEIKKNQPK
ncbi:MAG: ankyrin repeat domain-containing protein [Candidatus Berkiella sp.]